MKRIYRIAAVLPFLALGAMAQNDQADEMKAKLDKLLVEAKMMSIEGAVMGSPVKGEPYSATEVNESTQVLADGTRIHNENQVRVFRDGEGRIRRESPEEVSISDPVANVRYILNPKTQTAMEMPMGLTVVRTVDSGGGAMYRMTMGPMAVAGGMAAAGGRRGSITKTETVAVGGVKDGTAPVVWTHTLSDMKVATTEAQREELPARAIEGIMSKGTRTTSTIPAGAIGNDRPIQITSERWVASDLGLTMMSRTNDPRTGETYFHLTNVNRGEPDPALFQVPAGYQVVNGK